MKIIVCGSRDWTSEHTIHKILVECKVAFGNFTLIHGACRGADTLAGNISIKMEMITVAVPATWSTGGKAAGPKRNQLMLERGKPDLVIAFHDHFDGSLGTADMIRRAREAGTPVLIIQSDTPMSQVTQELSQLKQKNG